MNIDVQRVCQFEEGDIILKHSDSCCDILLTEEFVEENLADINNQSKTLDTRLYSTNIE